jgi:hypothetical protein
MRREDWIGIFWKKIGEPTERERERELCVSLVFSSISSKANEFIIESQRCVVAVALYVKSS